MIGTKFQKPLQTDFVKQEIDGDVVIVENTSGNSISDYAEAAAWCNENRAKIIDQGDYYEVVAIPEPTLEEQQAALVERFRSAIQAWMDGEARNFGYDNILSACSYISTGNAKFDAEGEGFRQWRSAVWATGYALIDEVLAGQREIPDDPSDVIALLPTLNIVYQEGE